MLRKILVRCPLLLLVVALLVMVRAEEDEQECKKGYLKFKGKCVKRFVPPKRKACPEPEFPNGEFIVRGQGRMAAFECDEGWMRVPDNSYAMCKV